MTIPGRLLRSIGWLFAGMAGALGCLYISSVAVDLKVPVRLQSGYIWTDSWDSYVRAVGTWIIEGEKSAFPLQTTSILCDRQAMTCSAAQAEIALEMLTVETYDYSVVSWTDDTIVYRDTAPLCVEYTYTISRLNQRAIGTRTTRKNVPGCETFEERALQLTMKDGFQVWLALQDAARRSAIPFMWAGIALCFGLALQRIWRVWRRQAGTLRY